MDLTHPLNFLSRAKLHAKILKMERANNRLSAKNVHQESELKRLHREKRKLESFVSSVLGYAIRKLDPPLRAKTLAKSKIVANTASNTKATVLGRLSKLRGTKGSLELPDGVINVPPPLPAAAVTTAVGTDDVVTGSA